jgi:hypothetical protein
MGTFPMYIRWAVSNLVCAVTTYFCVEAFYWQRVVHVNNMPVILLCCTLRTRGALTADKVAG